jgi:hypothetical protein
MFRKLGDIQPINLDRALINAKNSGYTIEKGGFSGAVAADDGDKIAFG